MAKVEPWKPKNPTVAPHKPETWHLGATEQQLFDSIANEHNRIIGTTVLYYSLNVHSSTRDPLYDEAIVKSWDGPFKVFAFVEYPSNSVNADDRGLSGTWNAKVYFPRLELEEKGVPTPAEGDVFRIWNTPYWNTGAVNGDDIPAEIPGRGMYFSITNIDENGVIFDNPEFVGFACDYSRNATFTPERRLDNK